MFKTFDISDQGFITYDSMLEALRSNNLTVNEKGLKDFFDKQKESKDKVTFNEFKKLVQV